MDGPRRAGRCAALALLAACCLARGGGAERQFLNEWAAEVPAGPDAARAIAEELDYDLVGQVGAGGGSGTPGVLPSGRCPRSSGTLRAQSPQAARGVVGGLLRAGRGPGPRLPAPERRRGAALPQALPALFRDAVTSALSGMSNRPGVTALSLLRPGSGTARSESAPSASAGAARVLEPQRAFAPEPRAGATLRSAAGGTVLLWECDCTRRSVSRSVDRSVGPPVGWSVNVSVSQSVSQSVCLTSHSVCLWWCWSLLQEQHCRADCSVTNE